LTGAADMDAGVKEAIAAAVGREPFARVMGLELVALGKGYSAVEMAYAPSRLGNIYGRAHGGALFGLIDGAFETAAQTDGMIAVALNVNVTYVSSPEGEMRLRAEARRIAETRRTATYDIRVTAEDGRVVALCQALAYKTGKPVAFP
jgi:acyl-CoA thioesterase